MFVQVRVAVEHGRVQLQPARSQLNEVVWWNSFETWWQQELSETSSEQAGVCTTNAPSSFALINPFQWQRAVIV